MKDRAPRIAAAMVAFLTLTGCGRHLARTDERVFPDPPRNAITFWEHLGSQLVILELGKSLALPAEPRP